LQLILEEEKRARKGKEGKGGDMKGEVAVVTC